MHRASTYITWQSGGSLVPGALCTVWCLLVVLDSFCVPQAVCSAPTWAVKPPAKLTQHLGGSWNVQSHPENGQKITYHPQGDPKIKQDHGDKTVPFLGLVKTTLRKCKSAPFCPELELCPLFLHTFQPQEYLRASLPGWNHNSRVCGFKVLNTVLRLSLKPAIVIHNNISPLLFHFIPSTTAWAEQRRHHHFPLKACTCSQLIMETE